MSGQTLKKHLAARRPARSVGELQARLDAFVEYYNAIRPHRSLGRRTPAAVFRSRTKAKPALAPLRVIPHCRIRQDRINSGNVTLRYRSRLYHVAVGRRFEGTRVLVLVADRDVRVVDLEGEVLRHLTLDPEWIYQPLRP